MAEPVNYTVARGHLGDEITDDGVKQKFFEVGDTRAADPSIVKHLVGTTLIDPDADDAGLRTDGPTIEEFVAAGYPAANYPPRGYASRSTEKEISTAIATAATNGGTKSEPPLENKADVVPENKGKPAKPAAK